VGIQFFQRRGNGEGASTEFAATELSLPPESIPAESLPPGGHWLPMDSVPSGMDSAPPEGGADLGADSLPAPVDATVEQQPTLSQVGRYALKGLLGSGGLGQVHEAWDPLLSRTVAVKTLQFNTDTPGRVSLDGLFLNEARAAAGLSHPNIVTVHDAGLAAQGVYIAMERLHGQDLRQRLAQGWVPTPVQAAQLVRRVADALAYAHLRGVVHCDIKPANIHLNKRDKPKVLDFGIARVAHAGVLPLLEGAVAGSPRYLAPEQLQGGAVDARTDIHALGVVFYELLTLRKAYNGDSVEQITTAVLTNHPAPAHELRPLVPRTLSAIAAKAMARDPAERYASAAEMALELRRWLDRESQREAQAAAAPAGAPSAGTRPVAVQVPPPHTRPRRTPARSGLGVALMGLALALGLAVAGVMAWRGVGNTTPPAAETAARPVPASPVATPPAAAPTAADAAAEPAPPATAPAASASEALVAPALAAAPTPLPAAPRPKPKAPAPTRGAAPKATAPSVANAPVATGTVQLAVSPWGHVDVDGQPAGTTPPLSRLTLTEGTHTISIRNDDGVPYTTTVQVQADKPATVRHRFAP
jgi:serine/threonine-protein kinase